MSLLGLFIFVSVLISYNGVESRKTIKTRYGDIYDCINFYKQPSLRHPMLKNHNFHPLMRPSFLPKRVERETHTEGCPVGTVPIRRSSKKQESFVAVNEPIELSHYQNAGVRTRLPGSTKYAGGSMVASVWNPIVQLEAYSQARMQISSGFDLIQVGWRVDRSLRGDNFTRLFIYTNANGTNCFDAECGFVYVSSTYYIDQVLKPVSKPGGPTYTSKFNITRDPKTGDWWLMYGTLNPPEKREIGFWPKRIFNALTDYATTVEWAGEVYSAPYVDEPVMGSGYKPEVGTTTYVAYFANLTVVNENYTDADVGKLQEFGTNRNLYDVADLGNVRGFGRLIFYGGARY